MHHEPSRKRGAQVPTKALVIATLLGYLTGESVAFSFVTTTILPISLARLTPTISRPWSPNNRPIHMSEGNDLVPEPMTFREAEVLGLQFMQERKFEEALKAFQTGMKLPGSKSDIVRTKVLSTSPVGGAFGGFESKNTQSLDEFEIQAANYNMACAHAQLGNIDEAINALKTAFENGFDNYETVRSDPDLEPVKQSKEFEKLMETYEPKKGFNPFGFFGGKK